jgi:hypothetical protein
MKIMPNNNWFTPKERFRKMAELILKGEGPKVAEMLTHIANAMDEVDAQTPELTVNFEFILNGEYMSMGHIQDLMNGYHRDSKTSIREFLEEANPGKEDEVRNALTGTHLLDMDKLEGMGLSSGGIEMVFFDEVEEYTLAILKIDGKIYELKLDRVVENDTVYRVCYTIDRYNWKEELEDSEEFYPGDEDKLGERLRKLGFRRYDDVNYR